jgi:hypothetical protein
VIEMLEVSAATFGLMAAATLAWMWVLSRELAEAREACDEGWGHVDRLLRERDEALGPFLALCDGTLGEAGDKVRVLAEARARLASAIAPRDRARASEEISVALHSLLDAALRQPMLPEGFPEAKAKLEELEEQLANRSELYDASVQRWNERFAKLPDRIVARIENERPRAPWRAAGAKPERVAAAAEAD